MSSCRLWPSIWATPPAHGITWSSHLISPPGQDTCWVIHGCHVVAQAMAFNLGDTTSGYDSPGIAPRGACSAPEIRKVLPGPPRHLQKGFSTLYHLHIAFLGHPQACSGPEPGDLCLILRACRTLHHLRMASVGHLMSRLPHGQDTCRVIHGGAALP